MDCPWGLGSSPWVHEGVTLSCPLVISFCFLFFFFPWINDQQFIGGTFVNVISCGGRSLASNRFYFPFLHCYNLISAVLDAFVANGSSSCLWDRHTQIALSLKYDEWYLATLLLSKEVFSDMGLYWQRNKPLHNNCALQQRCIRIPV